MSLLSAVENRNVDQVRALLDFGTDPNAKGASESTPLHYAAKKGDLEMVELLLEYGADPNVKDGSRSSPLHHAAEDGGHDGIVQLLLDYWAEPNAKNSDGSTPLHIAAKGKNVLVVKLLLDSKADPEAQDNVGNTPLHTTNEVDIARLLVGETVAISEQTRDTPMFPIMINGNKLDQSRGPVTGSLKTKYILVQSRTRLSPSDWKKLNGAGVKHLDYVSKNTYLCRYERTRLQYLHQLAPIIYVDIYRTELKVTRSLKEAEQQDQVDEVDIIFHENVDCSSLKFRESIVRKSQCNKDQIDFLNNKARLTLPRHLLEDMASIDDVRSIEDVGEVVKCNDVARQILKIEPPGSNQQHSYQGQGQIIAVADTGLDTGENLKLHHAFKGRVREWIALHNSTADYDGHGTHVCGSAVGNGKTCSGARVMGTAPQAELIVQSLWNQAKQPKPGLQSPRDLKTLFDPPYQQHAARVYSNSWLTSTKRVDSNGNPIAFRQRDYAEARAIDEFVSEH